MNKAELIAAVAERIGESKTKATEAVDAVFDLIMKALVDGEEVKVPTFGAFVVVTTKARVARNPQTNQEVRVPEGRRARFKPGKGLKEAVERAPARSGGGPAKG